MPWNEVSIMDQRREFVSFARQEGANVSALCQQFRISRKTGYKWLARADDEVTEASVANHSRRPHNSPKRTVANMEEQILSVRNEHPAWGARKIACILETKGVVPPSPSTVHEVLVRYDLIQPRSRQDKVLGSFERAAPNLLWQMDFKGQVKLGDGSWCHALTIVDDHSRFSLCIYGSDNQRTATVKQSLEQTFRTYGLPAEFYVDNGSPWGGKGMSRHTAFTVWLMKLGINVIHSKPYYPQGRGKNERFHRTLNTEVFAARPLANMEQAQRAFDRWRYVYNHERPHESLDMKVPASRYTPSSRPMPDTLPVIEYDSADVIRKVANAAALISFKGKTCRVPKAFKGERLAIRPSQIDGKYNICFGAIPIASIDLNQA